MTSTSDAALGYTWRRLPSAGTATATERVLFRFARALPEVVWDAAVLEGNPFTFPEVQTLLEGITIGGRKLSDQDQVLRLATATRLLHTRVAAGTFRLDKPTSDALHEAVATDEALEAGHFRGEGVAGGADSTVTVRLGAHEPYVAPPAGEGGANLRRLYAAGLTALAAIAHPYHRALAYFAFAALNQFYFDGNKRTARLMMNGELMANGFEAISVPAARKLEFNETMVVFFLERDATDLFELLASCELS